MKDDDAYLYNSERQSIPNMPQTESIVPWQTSSQGIPPNGIIQNEPFDPNSSIDRKIRFWGIFSLTLGLIIFFSYLPFLTSADIIMRETPFGGVFILLFGPAWSCLTIISLIISLISFMRVIVLSNRRKKHVFIDYFMVTIGLLLVILPFAFSGFSLFFGMTGQ